jgi:hypothetical protein
MKDFNIAKYLKEHSLGSHGILGKYVDLHPLKEEETNLGQQKAMKEPYEGPEDPIDGLGGKLNRHMDVSMNEAEDGSFDVSFLYADYPSISNAEQRLAIMHFKKLVKSLGGTANKTNDTFDTVNFTVSGVSSFDELKAAYDQVGEDDDYTTLPSWDLEPAEEAMPKSTYVTDDSEDDKGFIVPGDDAKVEEAEEIDMNEYDQLLGAIENLLRQGETAQNILRVVKDTLGMNEGMEDDSFIQAQRDAVGAKGSSVYGDSESEYYNRMMDLIDTTLEPQLPKVKKAVDLARQRGLSDMAVLKMLATNSLTRGTIKNLIDDGFDPQDIVDFFATDFSMQEDDINLADLDTEDVGA